MNVLFVLANFSFPPKEGIHFQSFNLMRSLGANGVDCFLLAYTRTQVDQIELQKEIPSLKILSLFETSIDHTALSIKNLSNLVSSRLFSFNLYSDPLFENVQKSIRDHSINVIHVEGLPLFPYLNLPIPTVFSPIDAFSLRQKRLISTSKRFSSKFFRLLAYYFSLNIEKYSFQRADLVHVVSSSDADYLKSATGCTNINVVGVGIPLVEDNQPYKEATKVPSRFKIVFTGDIGIDYIEDGLFEFIIEHYRPLKEIFPSLHFEILGRSKPSARLFGIINNDPTIQFHYWVEDYAQFLADSDLVILPDKNGTGLKNRALFAMSLGKVVVGTSSVFEGIPVSHKTNCLIAEPFNSFAKLVRYVFEDEAAKAHIETQAYQFVRRSYSFEVISNQWKDLYKRAMDKY